VIATLTLLPITFLAFIACFPWFSKNLKGDVTNGNIIETMQATPKVKSRKIDWPFVLLVIFNIVIVLVVNMIYVYA
jgi:hypothetical protein